MVGIAAPAAELIIRRDTTGGPGREELWSVFSND